MIEIIFKNKSEPHRNNNKPYLITSYGVICKKII